MLKAPVGTIKWRVSEARRVVRATSAAARATAMSDERLDRPIDEVARQMTAGRAVERFSRPRHRAASIGLPGGRGGHHGSPSRSVRWPSLTIAIAVARPFKGDREPGPAPRQSSQQRNRRPRRPRQHRRLRPAGFRLRCRSGFGGTSRPPPGSVGRVAAAEVAALAPPLDWRCRALGVEAIGVAAPRLIQSTVTRTRRHHTDCRRAAANRR